MPARSEQFTASDAGVWLGFFRFAAPIFSSSHRGCVYRANTSTEQTAGEDNRAKIFYRV